MKILLTGADGFIGKNFLENTTFNSIFTVSRSTIESNKIYQNYIGDLTDKSFIKEIAVEKFDIIIHAAWSGLPNLTEDMNLLNFSMYRNMIDELSKNRGTKHIFLGSCLEYGNIKGKVNEGAQGAEIDDFGQTKLKLLKYIELSRINHNWLRLFYVFGPYQHTNSLMRSIQRDIYYKRNIVISNPSKTHDFIYIKDVISLIDKMLNTNLNKGVYNCGNGIPVSLGKIANTVLNIMLKNSEFKEETELALFADINKTKKDFNWSPNYSLESGLIETLKMIKND
jgi:nucleoside-diphosphate-sugar epimerase